MVVTKKIKALQSCSKQVRTYGDISFIINNILFALYNSGLNFEQLYS